MIPLNYFFPSGIYVDICEFVCVGVHVIWPITHSFLYAFEFFHKHTTRVVCLCSCQRAQLVGRPEHRPASAPAWLLGVLLLLLSYTGRAWLQHLCLRSLCLNQHSALWQRTGTEHNVFSLCEGPWRPSTPTSGGAREEAVLWGRFQTAVRSFFHSSGNLCHAPCWFVTQNGWHGLLLYERLIFFHLSLLTVYFLLVFTLHQSCRERQRVHESHGWPYAGWLQCFTICS